MLHNKYFEVLKQFLGDYKAELYGRQLTGKVPLSHKAIALLLKELESKALLKSRRQGNIKYYRLNLQYSEVKDVIIVAELLRKIEFLSRNRALANLFRFDERIVGVFGSYARGTQKEDSDVDVFIVGNRVREDYDAIGRRFDLNVSIKYFSEQKWETLLAEKNSLVNELVANHVVMLGAERFVATVWRHCYGLD